jgi:hypothetical protein
VSSTITIEAGENIAVTILNDGHGEVFIADEPPLEIQVDPVGVPGQAGQSGPQGPQGAPGPAGVTNLDDLPEFTLLFENQLI